MIIHIPDKGTIQTINIFFNKPFSGVQMARLIALLYNNHNNVINYYQYICMELWQLKKKYSFISIKYTLYNIQ